MNKKSKIIITFDDIYGLPRLKAKNIDRSQLLDASIFLNGLSREKLSPNKVTSKKPNKVLKFFRCLYAVTKETRADKRFKEIKEV